MDSSILIAHPIKVDVIIDDDDLLNSFHAKWQDSGGYIAIARGSFEPEPYCELNNQKNGIYSKTLSYSVHEHVLEFHLDFPEYFDAFKKIHTVTLHLPGHVNLKKIKKCLRMIFQKPV